MAVRKRRYWDSDCFIAWLADEAGKVDDCRGVIKAAERGEVTIVTSSLTIAEVVKLKRHRQVPKEDAVKVRKFFRQTYIVIRELDRFLAEDAQAIVWDYGVDPKDAVHVATAINAGVEQLDTFDGPLIAMSGKIGNPPLVIGRPAVEEQLELLERGRGPRCSSVFIQPLRSHVLARLCQISAVLVLTERTERAKVSYMSTDTPITGLDLKVERVRAGVTVNAIAEKMAISGSRVSRIEKPYPVTDRMVTRYRAALAKCRTSGTSDETSAA